MLRLVFGSVLALLLAACSSQAPDCGALKVEQAWVRAVPPDAAMTGGYLLLRNPGPADVQVSGFASEAFGRVQMHMTMVTHGHAEMHHMDTVTVPAGGSVAFAPGGRHLMLFEPQQPLDQGQTLPMSLACGSAQLAFTATVRSRPPAE